MEPRTPSSEPRTAIAVVPNAERFRGAVVTPAGREIPITDAMVREACRALEQDRYPFRQVPARLS